MPENDVQITIKPYFSPEKIEHFNKWMRDRVALVLRLQDTGEIPCASRIPRCHVKRSATASARLQMSSMAPLSKA